MAPFRSWKEDSVPFLEDIQDTSAFLSQTRGQDLEVLIEERFVIDTGSVAMTAEVTIGR